MIRTIYFTSVVLLAAHWSLAQVIQLPSYREFSMTGGALVPDSGASMLGGVGYSANSYTSRGGPFPSGYASSGISSGSSAWASAQIIDLDALDQAILSANVPLPSSSAGGTATPSARSDSKPMEMADRARNFISAYKGPMGAPAGPPRYSDVQRALADDMKPEAVPAAIAESNIRYYLKLGREAENAGRIQSSRVYYRMAMEAMTPELIERYNRLVNDRQKSTQEQKKDATGRKRF